MLRTYQAFTFEEALERIRVELGVDAVILHSRTFKRGGWFGIGATTIVEVTASTPAARKSSAAPPRPVAKDRKASDGTASPTPKKERTNAELAHKLQALIDSAKKSRTEIDQCVKPIRNEPSSPVESSPTSQQRPTNAIAETQRPERNRNQNSKAEKSDHARPQRFVLQQPIAAGRVSSTPIHTDSPPVVAPEESSAKTNSISSAALRSDVPASQSPDTEPLSNELAALKVMVGQVLQRQSGQLTPALPGLLLEHYTALIQNEVARELADEICFAVRDELNPTALDDPQKVRDALIRHLSVYIPTGSGELSFKQPADGRPLTMALVGPTGVGKTTTVAKLAATFKLRHHKRVGLITTDTYRIAAVDQLRTYANIIGIPLKVALTPEEIANAAQSLDYCDVILIDTAGRSPNDHDRVEEVREFARAANPHEIHLVLSSTFSENVLMKMIDRFGDLTTGQVIFTKLDEAVNFGVIVNVMRQAGQKLSFVTTGQEVPDQIEPGSSDRLARLVLGESVHS